MHCACFCTLHSASFQFFIFNNFLDPIVPDGNDVSCRFGTDCDFVAHKKARPELGTNEQWETFEPHGGSKQTGPFLLFHETRTCAQQSRTMKKDRSVYHGNVGLTSKGRKNPTIIIFKLKLGMLPCGNNTLHRRAHGL